MLGKLIKHEFKQTSKSVIAIYFAALAAMLFMLLSYLTKITVLGILGSAALVIIGGLCVVMTVVAVVSNFQRSLYGNQGYLTFTLPVSSGKLLFSKFLVSAIWLLISYLTLVASFVIVFFFARVKTEGFTAGISGMMGDFEFIAQLPSKALIIKALVYLALGLFLNVVTFIGYVYFAITIANTRPLQKHPLGFGLGIFLLIYAVVQGIGAKLTYSLPFSLIISTENVRLGFISMDNAYPEGVLVAVGAGGIVFSALVAVGLLFFTGWVMERKVNVK